jgi:transposase
LLGGCSSRELALRDGLSERTVFRWTFERSRGRRPRQLGRAIGIDAYARRQGHHENTSIVDLGKGRPMATLKGRRADDVIAWFQSRPPAALDRVAAVVWEMSKTYASAIQ